MTARQYRAGSFSLGRGFLGHLRGAPCSSRRACSGVAPRRIEQRAVGYGNARIAMIVGRNLLIGAKYMIFVEIIKVSGGTK